jgi:hypothetical protein
MSATTTRRRSAAVEAAAPSLVEAAAVEAAAAAPVEAAAVEAAAPLTRLQKRDAWRAAQNEARALLAPLAGCEAATDATGNRKSGEVMICPAAHALLSLTIPAMKAEVREWSLKGGGSAFQVAGPIAPIEGAASERERALASAVNAMLAPFAGFRLRVVRYTGKRGVSYSAMLALAGR